jgi:hypothetical protein
MLRDREEKTKCRLIENVVEEGTPIRFGEPTFYPEELIQAISECLKGRKNVNAAYFQVMEAKGEVSFLLVVDFQGDKDELLQSIADAADKYLDGMYLNLMAYDNESGREVARKTKPIYKKKLFGIF